MRLDVRHLGRVFSEREKSSIRSAVATVILFFSALAIISLAPSGEWAWSLALAALSAGLVGVALTFFARLRHAER